MNLFRFLTRNREPLTSSTTPSLPEEPPLPQASSQTITNSGKADHSNLGNGNINTHVEHGKIVGGDDKSKKIEIKFLIPLYIGTIGLGGLVADKVMIENQKDAISAIISASTKHQTGDTSGALAEIAPIERKFPIYDVEVFKANLELDKGDWVSAIHSLEKARKASGKANVSILLNTAFALSQSQDYDAALSKLDETRSLLPTDQNQDSDQVTLLVNYVQTCLNALRNPNHTKRSPASLKGIIEASIKELEPLRGQLKPRQTASLESCLGVYYAMNKNSELAHDSFGRELKAEEMLLPDSYGETLFNFGTGLGFTSGDNEGALNAWAMLNYAERILSAKGSRHAASAAILLGDVEKAILEQSKRDGSLSINWRQRVIADFGKAEELSKENPVIYTKAGDVAKDRKVAFLKEFPSDRFSF